MLDPVLAAILVVVGSGAGSSRGGSEASAPFRLPSARETQFVSLEAMAGKVVYVDVTRTTCARCDSQAARLAEMRRKFADRGFEVVSVYDELPGDGADPFARVMADAKKKGYEHPIALNDGGEFHAAYYAQIQGTPSGFLVSRSGSVEPLGLDPMSERNYAKTTLRVEEALADSPGGAGSGPTPEYLAPFTILPFSGAPMRSSELVGRPTLMVAWTPGPLMSRLAPVVERMQRTYGDRMRVVAVTFGDFAAAADEAKRLCPSVMLAAPDTKMLAAIGATSLPQVLFLESSGALAKRIGTLYGAAGVEAAVIDRIAKTLVGDSPSAPAAMPAEPMAPPAASRPEMPAASRPEMPAVEPEPAPVKPPVASAPAPDSMPASRPAAESAPASRPAPPAESDPNETVFRDEKFGYSLPIPQGFLAAAGGPDDRVMLEELDSPMRVVARFAEGGSTADDLERYRKTTVSSRPGYKVAAEEPLENGATLVTDEWDGPEGRLHAARLFVCTPKGILEEFTSGPASDFARRTAEYKSTAQSVRVDK